MLNLTLDELERQLDQHAARYHRGALGDRELAGAFVMDVVESGQIQAAPHLLKRLPAAMHPVVESLLDEIRHQNYEWEPLRFGAAESTTESRYAEGFAQLDAVLRPVLADEAEALSPVRMIPHDDA